MDYLRPKHQDIAIKGLDELRGKLPVPQQDVLEKLKEEDVPFPRMFRKAQEYSSRNLPTATIIWEYMLGNANSKQQKFAVMNKLFQVQIATGPWKVAFETAHELFNETIAEYSLESSSRQTASEEAFDTLVTSPLLFNACLNLGLIHRLLKELNKAEQFYKKAREIAATSKDFDKEIVAKIHLATCLLDRGELKEAIETYFKPLMVFKTAMTTHTRALYLQHYGNACRSAADWGRAKEYLREALDLAKELKDIGLVSTCCGDLGNVFRSEGRYQDAERLHTVHHNLALSRGDIHGLAISCGNIGFLKFYNPEEFDDSVVLQFIEYSLSEEVGDFARMGIAFNKIGKLYTKLGYNEEAVEMFQIALDGARRAGNIAGEGMAWGNLGTVYRALEKFEDAITCHIKYRDNAERRMDTGGVAIMQHQLAMDYFLSGKLPEAERSILDAFETLEKIRSQIGEEDKSKLSNFEKNQADAYNLLQVVLVAQMKYKEALVLADSNRGRALAELVRKRLLGCNSSGAEDVTLNEEYIAESFDNLLDVARKLSTTLVFYSVVKEFDGSAAFYSWVYAWVLHPSGQLNFSKSRLQHGIRQTKVEVNDEFVLSLRRSMAQTSHTEDLGKILRCEKHLNISREAKGHAVTLQSEGVLNSLKEFQHMFSPYLSEANTENEKNLIHSGANIPYKTKDKELYHRPNFESKAYNPETDTQSNIENGNGETKEAAINDPKILSTSHAQSKPPFSTLKKISVEGECPEPDRKTVSTSEQALETTETQLEPPSTVCPSEAYAAEIQIEIEENSISEEDKSFEDSTYQLTTRPLNETTGHPSSTSESSVNSVQNNKETSRVKTEAFCESLRQSEEEGQTAALDAISVNPDESLQVSEYDEETSEEIEMEKSEISEENKSLEDSTDDAVNVTTTGHPSATNASSVNSVQNNEETSGVKTETCCESLRQNKVEDQQTAALNAISVNPDEYLKIFEYQEQTFEDLEGAETSLTKANSEGCDTPTLNEIYTEVEKDSVTTNCDTESALPDPSSDVMNEAPGTHSKQETVNNETSSTQQQNGNHIEKDVSVPGNDDVSEGTPPGPSNDVMTEPSGTIPKQHDKHESDPELDPWLPMLSQLHKVLIEPIVEYLPRKDENPRVTFIPQDFLLKVPFAALQSNAGDHYIMQDFVISTSPAIHFLELACASRTNAEQATAPQEMSLLGVGNPIMPFEDLPQLPSAQREVRMISEIINSPKSEVLVGSRAKKKDVITAMPKHKILHFATHAIIDDADSHGDFSMKGLIVLAKSGLECNGILTAEEVRRMELKAELVVLSCCDTGLGKVTGDGVLGLSRAFLAAGAACVIVTLWKIDDRSASELMTSFYREYRASRDAAVSLQRAMKILQAKEDTRSPQHWAAFSIVGATINSLTPKLET